MSLELGERICDQVAVPAVRRLEEPDAASIEDSSAFAFVGSRG